MGRRKRKRNRFPPYVKRLFKKVQGGPAVTPSKRELKKIQRIADYKRMLKLSYSYGGPWETEALLSSHNIPKVPRYDITGQRVGYRTVWYTGHDRRK